MSEAVTRVAWISRLDEREASRFSVPLLKQFGRDDVSGFECHAFVTGRETGHALPMPVAPLATDGTLSELLSTYDAAIFDLGGAENLTAMLPTIRRVPGVLILREHSYQSFFVQRCFGELHSASAFVRLMHLYYRTAGIDALLNSGVSSNVHPLIEPIAALASALVVHSDKMQTYARSFFHGPILRLEPQTGGDDADAGNSRRNVDLLKAFVRANRELLQRRARLVAPVRDAVPQPSAQPSDEQWWKSLLCARSAHYDLERDPDTRSPEPFLKWSGHDLARLIASFLLDAREPLELAQSILPFLSDRWEIYEAVSKLRWLQEFCQCGSAPSADATLPTQPIWDVQFWRLACQLKPPIFARLLYLAILQRPWKEYEPHSWVQLVESGTPPAAALIRFLATAEPRELTPEHSCHELMAWAEEQVLVQLPASTEHAVEWTTDIRVHFGDGAGWTSPMLIGQWYPPESVGRWTNGRSAGLSFRIPGGPISALSLELRLRVAGTERTGPRSVSAYCNGRWVHSLQFLDDAPLDWTIPLNFEASRDVIVVLIADRSFSPASVHGSSDARNLGIMLIEGALVAPHEAIEEQPPSLGSSALSTLHEP